MNRVIITGRITKDIDLRYTENSIAITNFNLAVKRDYKNSNGEYESDFVSCVAYRQTAELLGKYVKKGDLIGVEGRIQTRNYEDKDGKKVYVTEIQADRVEFLQSKGKLSNEEGKAHNEPKNNELEQNKDITGDVFSEFGNQIEITDDMIAF